MPQQVLAQSGEVFSTGGGLNAPAGLTFGVDGSLFMSSANTDEIMVVGPEGGEPVVFASGKGMDYPYGLPFGPDGRLYVASFWSDQVMVGDGLGWKTYSGSAADAA